MRKNGKAFMLFNHLRKTIATASAILALAGAAGAELTLFDAARDGLGAVRAQNQAQLRLVDGKLEVTTPPSKAYPGFTVKGDWDLSKFGELAVEFEDAGISGLFTLRLVNANATIPSSGCWIAKVKMDASRGRCLKTASLDGHFPDEAKILKRLTRVRVHTFHDFIFRGLVEPREDMMWHLNNHNGPGVAVHSLDTRAVKEVAVYINNPKLPHVWKVKRIYARGEKAASSSPLDEGNFFPFIDEYGQYRHRDWPGKTHTDADLAAQREKEAKDLAAHPGPKDWDKWGGWAAGPQLAAKGHFYVAKHDGKWWFVDPDGHLWWSHGPVRVSASCATTALDGHDDWFARLPKPGEPESEFYSTRDQLLFPYYARWKMKRIYDFSAQNLKRKYGDGWYETFSDLVHRRLRSWGCNTIANSSDRAICLQDRTPYTDRYEIHSRPIAGHPGGWWSFPDPFAPEFRAEAARKQIEYKAQFDDPWCFGFFVDNEHNWGNEQTFARSTLKSPADQPCKRVFRARLQAKYGDIAKLNAAWQTAYKDWEDFLAATTVPAASVQSAAADLKAFTAEIAETYFRVIKEEMHKAAPGKLYMGCRWAGVHAPAFVVQAAAKHCDILSYNIYAKHLRDFKLPEGVDKPVIVGEFHFGALDRGLFAPGLVCLASQRRRAEVYGDYVRSALEHPNFVGVHWHQFSDQATSGRFDGENMQVGWTDVCDTPYWETVEAIRKIGGQLYRVRAAAGK